MLRFSLLSVALVSACATIQTVPTEIAITASPIEQAFGLMGGLKVPAGTILLKSIINDKTGYCSQTPVAFISGENGRGACFFDTLGTGYFDRWKMLGGLSLTTAGGLHIPYSVRMAADGKAPSLMPELSGPAVVAEIEARHISRQAADAAAERAIRLEAARVRRDAGLKLSSDERALILSDDREANDVTPQDHRLSVAHAKVNAGLKLSPDDRLVIAMAEKAEADAKAQAEFDRQRRFEQDRMIEAEQRAQRADRAICEYASHSAGYVGYQRNLGSLIGASIGAAIEQNNVYNLCVTARAAAR